MNRLNYFSFVLLFLISFNCHFFSQTVDEIIQKNIEARGGVENWLKVQTLKIEGTYTSFSTETPFTIWRKRPNLYRFNSNRIEQDVIIGYDGEKPWWSNPLFGPKFAPPHRISFPDSMIALRDKEFDNILWDYQKKGHSVELLGKEDINGTENFMLKIILQDSTMEFWYIDSKTFLETKMTGTTYDFGRKVDLTTYFSDYREADGILLPYYVEQEYAERYRVFELSKVEINQTIDDTIFVMPESKPDSDK